MPDLHQWRSPVEYLELDKGKESSGRLPPPQVYELTDLSRFSDLDSLFDYCKTRSKIGVERWMPVIKMCTDAVVIALPGVSLLRSCHCII